MKLTILASALALCGGIALAQNPSTTAQQPAKKMGDQKMTAVVVSTDTTAQQITVRKLTAGAKVRSTDSMATSQLPEPADAPTFTLKVSGAALTSLSSFKAGDQVTISCKAMGGSAGTAGSGSILSQAAADAQCGTVTDISAAKAY